MSFEQILADLKKKIYNPVYFLQGEEPYYIDLLSDYIEQNILNESEKEFNQTILYGKDLDILTLISYARRYPMVSNYQVVIVKEAQDMKSLFQKYADEKDGKNKKEEKYPFNEYLLKPTSSTILVLCYKYDTVDKRTKVAKTLEKNAIIYESKRIYDDQLPNWINKHVQNCGLTIHPKAAQMLANNLGNDLTKITNEISKLSLNLKSGQEISPAIVEENIGVSKEFNIFELQNAIGKRNVFKAFQIAEYFSANPKNNPMVLTISQLYSYFLKVITYHRLDDRSKNNAASQLNINPYFLSDYITSAKEYSLNHCIRNISYIREYDLRSKGINNNSTNDGALLKELIYKILN